MTKEFQEAITNDFISRAQVSFDTWEINPDKMQEHILFCAELCERKVIEGKIEVLKEAQNIVGDYGYNRISSLISSLESQIKANKCSL